MILILSFILLSCKFTNQFLINANFVEGIEASLMPLDSPSIRAFVPSRGIGRNNKHWAGANGEWVTFVDEQARWSLLNVYTK